LLGKTPFDLMPPEEAERVLKIFDRIAERGLPIVDLENLNLTKSGQRVLLLTNSVPILDGNTL
jgi:PAS domain-containing protein